MATLENFLSLSTLLTILSSGIITVLVTFMTNLWLNNNSFKKEYYKKLIDKRLEAYEILENVNRILNIFAYDKKLNGVYFLAFSDPEYWVNLNQSMFQAMLYIRWHGEDTQKTLHQLSYIFAKIGDNLDDSFTKEKLETEASPYLKEILDLKRNLTEYSLLDFENLHDFNSFFSLNKKTIDQRRNRRQLLKK